jgi:hypothetical protein
MIPVSPPFFQETERAPSLRLRESVGWSFYWLLRPRSLGGIDAEFAGRILPDSTLEPSCRSLGIWWRFRIMLLTFYGMEMEMFASSFSTLGWLCLGQSPASSPAKMGMGESREKPLGISISVLIIQCLYEVASGHNLLIEDHHITISYFGT